jgi:phosphotransferase system HPr-like phosphotransfer protein
MTAGPVCESDFVVKSELGLHARPWVDGRSILSLLSLAASRGTRLRVRAEGPDAAEAVAALGQLLETGEGGR